MTDCERIARAFEVIEYICEHREAWPPSVFADLIAALIKDARRSGEGVAG